MAIEPIIQTVTGLAIAGFLILLLLVPKPHIRINKKLLLASPLEDSKFDTRISLHSIRSIHYGNSVSSGPWTSSMDQSNVLSYKPQLLSVDCGERSGNFSSPNASSRGGLLWPFFIKPDLSLRLSIRTEKSDEDASRLALATITSYEKTSHGCRAYMMIDGITGDSYDRLYWELSVGDPDASIVSSAVDIKQGTSETLVLIYSKKYGAPFYFDSMENADDDERYRLKPDTRYHVKISILDKNKRERVWKVKVELGKNGALGLYLDDE